MADIITDIPDKGWDLRISALTGGLLQSRAWAMLQHALGREPVYAEGEGWAWIAAVRNSRGVRYLQAPYGPVAEDSLAMIAAVKQLVHAGATHGADFVRFDPGTAVSADVLTRLGAKPFREVQPQRTLLLDLTKTDAELKSGVSQSNRNLINTAAGRGLTFEAIPEPTEDQVDQFLSMLEETVSQNHFNPYSDDYYRDTLRILGPLGVTTLFMAYINGLPVAGAISADFNDTRYYLHAAAFQQLNRTHKASAPLLWHLITDAKQMGMSTFDFWGIAPTDDPAHPRAGLSRFKRSFGGELKVYPGTWDLPIKQAKYRLYRAAKEALALIR